MRCALLLLVASVALAGSTGCANVTSAMGASTTVTGEAWYVKTTSFFTLPVKSRVYFCPPATTAAVQCTQAEIRR